MSQARIRKTNLPDAPKPTRAVRAEDPRDIEKAKRVIEHRELHLQKDREFVVHFWDEARLCKLRRLWNEGYAVSYIARECGCGEKKCANRLSYEIKVGRIKKRNEYVSEENKAKIYKLYNAGMSSVQLAKEFKIHKNSVSRIVRKMREKEGKK